MIPSHKNPNLSSSKDSNETKRVGPQNSRSKQSRIVNNIKKKKKTQQLVSIWEIPTSDRSTSHSGWFLISRSAREAFCYLLQAWELFWNHALWYFQTVMGIIVLYFLINLLFGTRLRFGSGINHTNIRWRLTNSCYLKIKYKIITHSLSSPPPPTKSWRKGNLFPVLFGKGTHVKICGSFYRNTYKTFVSQIFHS